MGKMYKKEETNKYWVRKLCVHAEKSNAVHYVLTITKLGVSFYFIFDTLNFLSRSSTGSIWRKIAALKYCFCTKLLVND